MGASTALLFVLITWTSVAPAGAPRVPRQGDAAPRLELEHIIQGPPGASTVWGSLKGRAVVVEFWATWCAPCVSLIPDLNKIEARFDDDRIRFIWITDEDEGAVRAFLKNHSVSGWIAVDADRSVFRAYAIDGLPTTVLIDGNGKLAGWIHPYSLIDDPSILSDLIAGKVHEKVSPTPLGRGPDPFANVLDDLALPSGTRRYDAGCLLLIRPATQEKRLPYSGDAHGRRYDGLTPLEAIARVYEVPVPYVRVETPLPENTLYDIVVRWPVGRSAFGRALLRYAVSAFFEVEVRAAVREMDVDVLSLDDGGHPPWEPAPTRFKYDPKSGQVAPTKALLERIKTGERFFWTVGDTAELAAQLGDLLGRPVVDEASIDGHFLFWFPRRFDAANRKDIVDTLHERYGLKLTPGTRRVQVFVVDKPSEDR